MQATQTVRVTFDWGNVSFKSSQELKLKLKLKLKQKLSQLSYSMAGEKRSWNALRVRVHRVGIMKSNTCLVLIRNRESLC
jgi:hypothetical protein